MTADHRWNAGSETTEMADSLYARLRCLERRQAPQEDFERIIEDFYAREPTVKAAMPQFSTFGLLEAIRNSRDPGDLVNVGRFSARTAAAIRLLRQLSCEDVSLSHPRYSPSHPHFSSLAAALGGLFFWFATPETCGGAATSFMAVVGAICAYLLASAVRYFVRNSNRRSERPQWICALHVDRYLQAHHRGERLPDINVEDLPQPGLRCKAPFYDLHNQIMAGQTPVYHGWLRQVPPLVFPAEPARTDES